MNESISYQLIARMIDHSLLHPTMTDQQITEGLELSRDYQVATACVKPYSVRLAQTILTGSSVGICAVIGFPHGNSTIAIKSAETEQVLSDGATEVDMVVNIGKVMSGDWDYVHEEISAINTLTVGSGGILKVIFETDYLEDSHIIRLCEICSAERVAFVKTSTGYGFVKGADGRYSYAGATDHNVRLMRQHCAPEVQIKAAGGVRDLDTLLHFYRLGVTRFGATATEAMILEARQREN